MSRRGADAGVVRRHPSAPVTTGLRNRLPCAAVTAGMTGRLGRRGGAAIVLAVALTAVLGSCGDTEDAARGRFEPAVPGELRVAADLPAPGYWDDDGFERGIAEALAERFGLRLVVVDVAFAEIAAGELGGADLALAQLSVTDDREGALDFSIPYDETSPTVLGRADDEIADLATARDRTWAVVDGTLYVDDVAEVIRPDRAPLVVTDDPSAASLVRNGEVDAALLDTASAAALAAESAPGIRLGALARLGRTDTVAAGLPEGSPNRVALDAALRALIADGTVDDLRDRLWTRIGLDPDDLPVIRVRVTPR